MSTKTQNKKYELDTGWLEKEYDEDSPAQRAFQFAREAHKDDKRVSGEPFVVHCLEVAKTVHSWGLDQATIVAALLHDVAEDTEYSLEDIKEKFGNEIKFLVDGLTKLEKLQYTGRENQAENMRKLVIATSQDLRVIFIKLADRLHNMKTLDVMPEETKEKKSRETYDIYAPLAYRLGMQALSGELRDLAFPYLYPEEYEWLMKNVKEQYEEREQYIERIKPMVEERLEEAGLETISIDARAKRYSSLYKKLIRYDMDFGKIYDLVALRIIVDTVEDCYAVLGVLHEDWPPVPGRIKDYIALPKPNGYRSLHTTVFCIDDKITEFQIRTKQMHEEAEFGAAAHWAYNQAKDTKEYYKKDVPSPEADHRELLWVKQLKNWQENFQDSEEFMESLKEDFFKDRIFVVTPEHDVLDLPAGATPVDFAYRIHSEIGDQCAGAKVNDNIVPLDYELQSGDVVEIMTQKGKKPSESWLDFVTTSTAISHIKSALKKKKDALKKRHTKPKVTFKITAKDRKGLLKDVGDVFSRSNINITSINSSTGPFPMITVNCGEMEEKKVEKLKVKLKDIDDVQEVKHYYKR